MYSLQALKNSSSSDPLVTVIKLQFDTFNVDDVLVDEIEIVCFIRQDFKRSILVIDFGAYDRMPVLKMVPP